MLQSNQEEFRPDVTIADNAAISSSIELGELRPRGLQILVPAGWVTANIAFEVSEDTNTWFRLFDSEGAQVVISGVSTSEARLYQAPPEVWGVGAWPYLRLRSVTVGATTDVNQTGGPLTLTAVINR